jgi:hypothetical protein
MSEYVIESGIAAPHGDRGRHNVYPFESMKPGDSFFLPGASRLKANSVRTCGANYCRRHPERNLIAVTRKQEGGYRVWLISRNGNDSLKK